MSDDTKIRIYITRGSLVLTELHAAIDEARHEFRFSQPITTAGGRSFTGFAVECWLDREPRHVTYREHDARILLPG